MNVDETLLDSGAELHCTVVSLGCLPVEHILRDRYRILKKISSGGFGITYKAEDMAFNRIVAIKEFFMEKFCDREGDSPVLSVIRSAETRKTFQIYKDKFIKEARVLSEFKDCRGIVNIIDVFEENGTAYYAMDYIEGESVHQYVKRKKKLSEEEAKSIVLDVAETLRYVHNKNYLHLDVKPQNIMRDFSGNIILIDFGVSKHYNDDNSKQTTQTPVAHSRGYAPLEQLQNNVEKFLPATDVYALGGVYYFLVTGMNPPNSSVDFELPWDVPISMQTKKIINRMMMPRKMDRPQNMQEVIRLMTESVVQTPITDSSHFEFQGTIDYGADNEIIKLKWVGLAVGIIIVITYIYSLFT